MTDENAQALVKQLVHAPEIRVVGPSCGPAPIDPRYTVIGTSGSTDYLHDTTGNQRFWPVSVWGIATPDDGQICDGLHAETAPNRCVHGVRGDLAEPHDDEYDEARPDEAEEME